MYAHLDLHGVMGAALDCARAAEAAGDVPVGAVIVRVSDGALIASAGNEREVRCDPTAHAEVVALRAASAAIGSWHLDGHLLVVTLEPCPMCAGAALAARIDGVVFGAHDPKAGACGSLYNLAVDPRLNHDMTVTGGLRAGESAALLVAFFSSRREGRDL